MRQWVKKCRVGTCERKGRCEGVGDRKGETEGQWNFVKSGGDNSLLLKGPQIKLTEDELARKSEIIRALESVDSNYSFASTIIDARKYQEAGGK